MKEISRPEYLNWLQRWQNKKLIKVVSGVRRCGKSTMFQIFQKYLLQHDVDPKCIISINFEDLQFEALQDYHKLYEYILQHLQANKMNYIFLDEIQHVKEFEKAVDSLFLRENCDIYLTGSNAYFMSGDLATLLTGRYVELSMLPLSFDEYRSCFPETDSLVEIFGKYLRRGAFPYVLQHNFTEREIWEYLSSIYRTVLLNDVVKRCSVVSVDALEDVTKFLMHNIGNRTSPTTIANTMVSARRKTDKKTIEKYLYGLRDALLFYYVRRYNIKGKEFLHGQGKYYVCDVGIRNMLVGVSDAGHVLENIVYLELRRRYGQVFTGAIGEGGEVDFVVNMEGKYAYYQVALTVLDENTLHRELAPLRAIKDNYPKYLLTLDQIFDNVCYDGIEKVNVLNWLLKKE